MLRTKMERDHKGGAAKPAELDKLARGWPKHLGDQRHACRPTLKWPCDIEAMLETGRYPKLRPCAGHTLAQATTAYDCLSAGSMLKRHLVCSMTEELRLLASGFSQWHQ